LPCIFLNFNYPSGQSNCTACPIDFFQDGTDPTRCRNCSEVNYDPAYGCRERQKEDISVSYTSASSLVLIVLTVIVILMCLFVLVSFYLYQNTPVVKAASPLFCYLILTGLIIGASTVFLMAGRPSPVVCVLRPWFVAIALALVMGNLLVKTWRISRIFGFLFPSLPLI